MGKESNCISVVIVRNNSTPGTLVVSAVASRCLVALSVTSCRDRNLLGDIGATNSRFLCYTLWSHELSLWYRRDE